MEASLAEWAAMKTCRIERNDCTRLHRLADALLAHEVENLQGERLAPKVDGVTNHAIVIPEQTFVVRHDWLAAVGDAADVGNEFRLPFNHCAFEFRINGLTLVNIAMQPEGGRMECVGFVESEGRWCCLGYEGRDIPAAQFAWEQVRSVCVALDADVATHDVVRAPAKLNASRERKGKHRIADHRVIDLSRRHRTAPLAATSDEPKGRKRLHFRRGHWRHYDDHKTWIKWTLVGNPDLGFIDHHYAL